DGLASGGVNAGGNFNPTGKLKACSLGAIHKSAKAAGQPTRPPARKETDTALLPQDGPDPTFKMKRVYCSPNPLKRGQKAVIHVEVGIADSVRLQFYGVSGDLVHETELSGPPRIMDDGQGPQYAY